MLYKLRCMHGADVDHLDVGTGTLTFLITHLKSHLPNDELHLAFACCIYKDGNKLGVSRTKDPMRTNCHREEIFFFTACLQDNLPSRQREIIHRLDYLKVWLWSYIGVTNREGIKSSMKTKPTYIKYQYTHTFSC